MYGLDKKVRSRIPERNGRRFLHSPVRTRSPNRSPLSDTVGGIRFGVAMGGEDGLGGKPLTSWRSKAIKIYSKHQTPPSDGTAKMRSLEAALSPTRNHASRGLVQARESTNKVTNRPKGQKLVVPPTLLPLQHLLISLITNIGCQNTGNYATMCMIAGELGPRHKKS